MVIQDFCNPFYAQSYVQIELLLWTIVLVLAICLWGYNILHEDGPTDYVPDEPPHRKYHEPPMHDDWKWKAVRLDRND